MVNETNAERDKRWQDGREAGDYLIRCIAAALRGKHVADDDVPQHVTWEQTYALAAFHCIEAISWAGMPSAVRDRVPKPIATKWQNMADMTLFRQLSYDAEREDFLKDFRDAGLAWLPLKGILTATYYPQPGLRSMSDQDLLFGFVERNANNGVWQFRGQDDAERAEYTRKADELATRIVQAHGFTKTNERGRELIFAKRKLTLELHREVVSLAELANGSYTKSVYEYYCNPWRLTIPDDAVTETDMTYAGEFHLRIEDQYLFHIVHMFKHYREAGFGLRFLIDEAVFCEQFSKKWDWPYIHQTLQELCITDFEDNVRNLSQALFTYPENWRAHVTEAQRDLMTTVIFSGTYGTQQGSINRQIERQRQIMSSNSSAVQNSSTHSWHTRLASIFRYGWQRIYPPKVWVRAFYPQWSATWWQRATLPLYRVYLGVRQHPKRLLSELRILLKRQ